MTHIIRFSNLKAAYNLNLNDPQLTLPQLAFQCRRYLLYCRHYLLQLGRYLRQNPRHLHLHLRHTRSKPVWRSAAKVVESRSKPRAKWRPFCCKRLEWSWLGSRNEIRRLQAYRLQSHQIWIDLTDRLVRCCNSCKECLSEMTWQFRGRKRQILTTNFVTKNIFPFLQWQLK